ncbi:FecR family protein [Sphingosinicella rhizophila]|uniref:FecR domain-containing protein n=1 Tax=Sphingosinicella rhizophila TaxID=3050082 RepID=A0ABU3Q5I1_9SPHN|nr:FecR domain-containing protein [Sphingosinicella sp. GR2756]MDT9598661.1 FecR domain-containing protein [Sphingosinicella sp. GR2756]
MSADVEQQAAEWVARRDAAGLGREQDDAFSEWIGASIANRVAYLRLAEAWRLADQAAALRPAEPEHEARRPWPLIAASIALLIGFAATFGVIVNQPSAQSFNTKVGERQRIALSDGSRIELNTQSALKASVTSRERHIVLARGEAFFEVASNSRLPFVIDAGSKRITVVGTKFSVRRDQGLVEVAVVEGKVRIADTNGERSESAIIAAAGDMMVARANQTLLAHRGVNQVNRETSWRQGVLTFDSETLASAAAEFNRYNVRQLVIAPDVAGMRIGGTFHANDVDDFTYLLRHGFGLRVETDHEKIFVKGGS